MKEIEKENTYLLSSIPDEVRSWDSETVLDIYIPEQSDNPQIRLRSRGDTRFITKKYPLVENDLSTMVEETINLSEEEFNYLKNSVKGNYLAKTRYKKVFGDVIVEVDEYLDNLSPLMVLDIEWVSAKPGSDILSIFDIDKEITQSGSLAAGKIAGKSYDEIKQHIV